MTTALGILLNSTKNPRRERQDVPNQDCKIAMKQEPGEEINRYLAAEAARSIPETYELAKIAATLATAEAFADKPYNEIVYAAVKLWQTCEDFQSAQKEKAALVSTAGRVEDKDGDFGDLANRSPKGVKRCIPSVEWMRRLQKYPGHRYDLWVALHAASVPRKDFLRDLFPKSETSRSDRLTELIGSGRDGRASKFIESIADLLTHDQPESKRQALFRAVRAEDSRDVDNWFAENGLAGIASKIPGFELFHALQSIRKGETYHFVSDRIPALLCRWLIHAHQERVSQVRSEAGRSKKHTPTPSKNV